MSFNANRAQLHNSHLSGKTVTGGSLKFNPGTAAVGAGTILGGGTSAAPVTTSSASHFLEWRGESTASSGTTRLAYYRLYSNGAGQDNDAMRIFHTTQKALAGAHGAHISCDFDTNGSVTGLATGLRCTLHVPDRALAANGNYYGFQAEIHCDGNSSDISPVTQHAIMSLTVGGGNATARDLVLNAISLTGSTGAGDGKMISIASQAAGNIAGTMRWLINGTVYHVGFYTNQAS